MFLLSALFVTPCQIPVAPAKKIHFHFVQEVFIVPVLAERHKLYKAMKKMYSTYFRIRSRPTIQYPYQTADTRA